MKDLVPALVKVGFPVVLALLLLGWLREELMVQVRATARSDELERHTRYDEPQTRLLRLICRNTASNPALATECDR